LINSFEVSKTNNGTYLLIGKRTYDAKAVCREGNSPDHKLKSLNND